MRPQTISEASFSAPVYAPLSDVQTKSARTHAPSWSFILIGLLALCSAVIALFAWVLRPGAAEIAVAEASYQDLSSNVSTTGRVIPVDEFQARANFPGMVEKVYVHVGDVVKPGQLLIQLKDPFATQRVAAATANLEAAEVSSHNIQQNGSQEDQINLTAERQRALSEQTAAASALEMFKRLQQTGEASGAEVNAATRRLEEANTTLRNVIERSVHRYSAPDRASWEARVADARANLQAQKITFANANITSPVAGTVYLIPVAAYDFVQMGADLLRVADLSRSEIRASFDEPDIWLLHAGAPARVTWDGKPNVSWTGHVLHPPMAAEQRGNRTVGDCTISVDDPRHELLPNTNVVVSVTTQQRSHRLAIPREALHTSDSQNFVYRVEEGRVKRTPVEVGMVNLTQAEITRGLTVNDVIALRLIAGGDLADNLRVKVGR